jgi:GxxExxY protein
MIKAIGSPVSVLVKILTQDSVMGESPRAARTIDQRDSGTAKPSCASRLRGEKCGGSAHPDPTVQESLTTASYFTPRSHEGTKMTLIDSDPYSRRVIGCAIEVHRIMGPGLIESVYEACLCHELTQAGMAFVRQQKLPIVYKKHHLDCNLMMDVVVEKTLVLEIKSVCVLHPIHEAQLLTYLKPSGLRPGLLLNLNEIRLIDGVRRRLL